MIGCKKLDEQLNEPYNKCLGCKHKHRAMAMPGETYVNHNGVIVPNCLWVDHKYKPKEAKVGGK